jgi:hypothetical protein
MPSENKHIISRRRALGLNRQRNRVSPEIPKDECAAGRANY